MITLDYEFLNIRRGENAPLTLAYDGELWDLVAHTDLEKEVTYELQSPPETFDLPEDIEVEVDFDPEDILPEEPPGGGDSG